MSIKFGAAAHQQLEPETAARLLEALFTEAPGVFGYFLAVAVTGAPPSRPRSAHTAPDQQQPGQLRPVPSATQK
jgi:hypothetical protein